MILQNTLTSSVVHNGLPSADRLILGVVRVWGAGDVKITGVTLTDVSGKEHPMIVNHNTDTQVSWVLVCLPFSYHNAFLYSIINVLYLPVLHHML